MRPIRRLALDRRTLLRGAGCALALPWLDAMQPACTRPLAEPRRAVFVFAPNGRNMAKWRPNGEGGDAIFGATLEPLQPVRERLTVFSGLAIDAGRAHGDGTGDHARASSTFLTCAHPRKTGGADIHVGISVDQLIAAHLGDVVRFPSLELGMERGRRSGVCDSGYSCAYVTNISWRTPSTPVAKESDPRAAFARLFGDPDAALDASQARRQRQRTRSILDAVLADAGAMDKELGATDRRKLDDYLQAVREVEQRLERDDASDGAEPARELPPGIVDGTPGYPERLALMFEIIALALATDSTRVVTFMLGNAGSDMSHRFLGVPEAHHDLSHHGRDPEKLERIARIDRFQIEQLATFLQRLAAERCSDSDLLANSLVLFGSGIGDGNAHNHHDLPILLAGEGGGAARPQGHVRFRTETPLANLHLAILQALGAEARTFADSTAPLQLT